MSFLIEGLKSGDLDDLIQPIISIDEFESKIDKDAVVTAFFVSNEDAADDLAFFIESGNYDILDADVSPGPDDDGHYLVFVEFIRNKDFPKTLKEILDALENLTNVDSWKFTWYKSDKELDFDKKAVMKKVRLEKSKRPKNEREENIFEFLQDSFLDNIKLNKKSIKFIKGNKEYIYENITIGDQFLLSHLLCLNSSPVKLDDQSLTECRKLRFILGKMWEVDKVNDYLVVSREDNPQIMLLTEKKK